MNYWNYLCKCGHRWTCWWDKYSKDECSECGEHVLPEEKLQ